MKIILKRILPWIIPIVMVNSCYNIESFNTSDPINKFELTQFIISQDQGIDTTNIKFIYPTGKLNYCVAVVKCVDDDMEDYYLPLASLTRVNDTVIFNFRPTGDDIDNCIAITH